MGGEEKEEGEEEEEEKEETKGGCYPTPTPCGWPLVNLPM